MKNVHMGNDTRSTPVKSIQSNMSADIARLIFIHVPKSGGTTMDRVIRSHFPQDEVCPERHDGIKLWIPEVLNQYKLFSMHDSYSNVTKIPGPWQVMTLLREPIDRLLSQYVFWCSLSQDHVERHNLSDVRDTKLSDLKTLLNSPVPELLLPFDNLTTRFLSDKILNHQHQPWRDDQEMLDAALSNLETIDFCGISEYMSESIDMVCRMIDRAPPTETPWANVSRENHTTNPDLFEPVGTIEIDEETEELLRYRTRLDTIVYEAALQKFLSQIGPRPRRFDRFHHTTGIKVKHYSKEIVHGEWDVPGFLMFGPYCRLRSGGYEAQFQLGLEALSTELPSETPVATVDVVSGTGAQVHAQRTVTVGDLAPAAFTRIDLPFQLPLTVSDLEFRVFHTGITPLAVESLVLLDRHV